ncbi:MAG: hypothetical protein Q8P48_10625, partial [Deltaproteobacteria bacterium]|nr:hypothetical protein [Deltaproteobacteria bacterium]
HFDARRTNKGVTVKVRKSSGRKVVQGAFMPERIKGVYKREGKGRFPIKRLYGPDVPGMVSTVGMEAAEQVIDEKADKILTHEFEWEMRKR